MTPEREARLRAAAAWASDLTPEFRPTIRKPPVKPKQKPQPEPPKPRRYLYGIDITDLFADEPEPDLGDDWEAPVLTFRRR